MVAQNSSKPPWKRPEKSRIRGFTFQADFKKGITCDQKRKYAIISFAFWSPKTAAKSLQTTLAATKKSKFYEGNSLFWPISRKGLVVIKNGNTQLFPSRFGHPKQLQLRSKPPWWWRRARGRGGGDGRGGSRKGRGAKSRERKGCQLLYISSHLPIARTCGKYW